MSCALFTYEMIFFLIRFALKFTLLDINSHSSD